MSQTPTDAEHLSRYVEEVGDFYAWIRDYWTEMGQSKTGTASGMLNFGYWDASTESMFDAQCNLWSLVIRSLGDLRPGSRGLEIGCGIGGAAIRTVRETPVSLTCMDLIPAQIEIASKSALEGGVADRLEFCLGSAMDMPFDDASLDFSYCIESSFHYPDKRTFFRESLRVLKPGARAVLADITCEDNSLVSFRRGNFFLAVEQMKELMLDAGFVVENVISIGGQVFKPLQAYVEEFSQGRRGKLYRYWNLVLKNYLVLSEQGKMGYEIFILRKPGG